MKYKQRHADQNAQIGLIHRHYSQERVHNNMLEWTEEQRRKVNIDSVIHQHLKGELSQKDAATALDVSQPTFSRMVQKYAHSTSLDRRRRYDLASHLHTELGFTLQVLVPGGGQPIPGVPSWQWSNLRPDKVAWPAGPVWVCPPFSKNFAPTYFSGIRKAVAGGSTVICACPGSWRGESWAMDGVRGILTPLGNYHLRRYTAKGKKTRYCGRMLVLRFEPGDLNPYTNTIPEPDTK